MEFATKFVNYYENLIDFDNDEIFFNEKTNEVVRTTESKKIFDKVRNGSLHMKVMKNDSYNCEILFTNSEESYMLYLSEVDLKKFQ